jgi:heptosyltransferase-1
VRILIVRTSSLGDVVHALPVLTALRRHLPRARLGWVVEESLAPLLAGHPDLDAVLSVRLRRWGKEPFAAATLAGVQRFLAALRGFEPEVVLDLMGNHKAGAIAQLSGAPRRIGAARRDRREPSSALWINEPVEAHGTHAVDRALSLLAALGLPAERADFGGGRLLPGSSPPPPAEPFVLIHAGAGWGNKRYPPSWWGQAARHLRAATGLPALAAVAAGEEDLAAEVAAASGGAASAVLAAGLPALVALLRQARLVLGGDSGPLHLAHALGTPVLMVMGPTDPARHGPYGAPERALFRRLPCSFCYRRFAAVKACLLELPPDRVAMHAAALLGGPARVNMRHGSS